MTTPRAGRAGFTIIEVLIAIIVLTIGIFALAAGSASITRNITEARQSTVAAQVLAQRIERLRAFALTTSPRCTSANFTGSAGPVTTNGVTETWSVGTGLQRTITARATYRIGSRTHTDSALTYVYCY